MDKMDGRSSDILEENIEKMKQLFPEVFTEGKVDLEKLGQVLGEYAEDEDERYDFTWNGKKDAIRISQTPTTGTLRPDKENSKNWNETENLYIEGDNLEVLKLLQKSYHSKVKMIYIDPPYNTGKDFVYKDNYRDNMKNYLEYTGQVDSEGKKISTNAESSGRYHTDWLNMIYPRLRLARNLLTEDGVIFISIDDNEVDNLRKICDEIFGEDNFIASLIINGTPKSDPHIISTSHEYCLAYAKNFLISKNAFYGVQHPVYKDVLDIQNRLKPNYEEIEKELNQYYTKNKLKADNIANYKYSDKRGVYRTGPIDDPQSSGTRDDRINPITGNYCRTPAAGWRCNINTWKEWIKEDLILFPDNDDVLPSKKTYITEDRLDVMRNIFNIQTRSSSVYLKELFQTDINIFSNPKPLELIKTIAENYNDKNMVVLDFFAGSSTTAHATIELNRIDNGNRKFIMVQLPEDLEIIKPNSNKEKLIINEAIKFLKSINKPLTISEIGKERIRRAGEKIKEDNKDKEGIEDLDIGFKSFKLDSSNIKEWNPEYEDKDFDFESLVNNFVEDRSEEDILYEIILKYGIDLTVPMEEHSVDEKTIYDIGFGALYICLDNNINENIIEKIVELNKESGMERSRVVFKDTGFKNDEIKLNAKLTLENNGIEEVLSI